MKSLGKANDNIPADEMFVAKIIQNAKGRGLGWTKLREFAGADGWSCSQSAAVACCASGSARLERDTRDAYVGTYASGNDFDTLPYESDVIGRAYRDAMGGNEVDPR